jgi:hypothetical protein
MTGVKEPIRRVESEESPTANGSLEPDRERTSGVKKAYWRLARLSRSYTSSGVPQTSSLVNGSPSIVDDDHLLYKLPRLTDLDPALWRLAPVSLWTQPRGSCRDLT